MKEELMHRNYEQTCRQRNRSASEANCAKQLPVFVVFSVDGHKPRHPIIHPECREQPQERNDSQPVSQRAIIRGGQIAHDIDLRSEIETHRQKSPAQQETRATNLAPSCVALHRCLDTFDSCYILHRACSPRMMILEDSRYSFL